MPKKVQPRKNYGRSIGTFAFLTVVVLVAAGVYGYTQFSKLTEVNDALAKGQSTLSQLQTAEKRISSDYAAIKSVYDDNFNTIKESINAVYPSEEQYTDLTRLLDEFMAANNQETLNPIFMSDLKFSAPRIDKENDYAVLPFTISLTTTRDNFEKFLEFVESSGSLDTGIRLMEVKKISISFPSQELEFDDDDTGSDIPTMTVSLTMNAFFQPPPDTSA